jgi:hypothetical protein
MEFQLEEAAHAGCFQRVLALDYTETIELRTLGYRVEFSHAGIFHSPTRKYYVVSW